MKNINKLNKLFIVVIIATIVAYLIDIINLSFFANDFTQITGQIQMISGLIPDQDVQNINATLDFVNNTANIVRTLLITISLFAGIASVIAVLITKLFADRITKFQSVFSYCGLIIASFCSAYLQFRIFPRFDGVLSLVLIIVTLAIIAISILYLVIGIMGLAKFVKSDKFKAGQVGFDLAKILSVIFIFYVVAILSIRTSLYISVTVLVQEIDLASLIDVMNYINIDWETIIPPAIFATGIISSEKIDFVINNLADQYILNSLSLIIQNVVLDMSRSIIFTNMIAYITTLISGLGILYVAKNKVDYKEIIVLVLMAIMAVVGFIYLNSFLVNLLAIGFIFAIGLVGLEVYKQYK